MRTWRLRIGVTAGTPRGNGGLLLAMIYWSHERQNKTEGYDLTVAALLSPKTDQVTTYGRVTDVITDRLTHASFV